MVLTCSTERNMFLLSNVFNHITRGFFNYCIKYRSSLDDGKQRLNGETDTSADLRTGFTI